MKIHDIIKNITLTDENLDFLMKVDKDANNLVSELNSLEWDFVESYLNLFLDKQTNISYRLVHGVGSGDVLENYFYDLSKGQTALELLYGKIKDNNNKLTADDVKYSHCKLTKMEPFDCSSGEFRNTDIKVGVIGEEHTLFPPKPDEIDNYFEDFLKIFNSKQIKQLNDHPFVRSAILHYFFIYIHPFKNGNGRMARLLQNAFLQKEVINKYKLQNEKPLVLLSSEFEVNRGLYHSLEKEIDKNPYKI